MKVSLRSEHALLPLICLARQANHGGQALASLAGPQNISVGSLKEILDVLVTAKYLDASRDSYRLAQPADRISVVEVIRLFDGALAPHEPVSEKGYDAAPMDHEHKLSALFESIQDDIT